MRIGRAAAHIEQQINLRAAGSILEVRASNGVVAFGDTQSACNGMRMVPGDYFKRVATPGFVLLAARDRGPRTHPGPAGQPLKVK